MRFNCLSYQNTFIKAHLCFLLFCPFGQIRSSFCNRFSCSCKVYSNHLIPTGEFGFENLKKQIMNKTYNVVRKITIFGFSKNCTCDSVPSCNLVTRAYSGLSIILNSSCDNFTAAARTSLVDFLPNLQNIISNKLFMNHEDCFVCLSFYQTIKTYQT